MVNRAIKKLIQYGLNKNLIQNEDVIYTTNQLLALLNEDSFLEPEDDSLVCDLQEILTEFCEIALKKGLLSDRAIDTFDLFDTKVMNCLMPRPSEVIRTFDHIYKESKEEATNYFYTLSCNSNYVRTDRIKKDIKWKTGTRYGELDITINMAKPEKDPKAIAAARNTPSSNYPKCLLCKENEGYSGRINHPARQNHRIIPMTINQEPWYMQYSPYVYYDEHCIVFSDEHRPMEINKDTFKKLLDFLTILPHYFVGSNADLPIVGGSILSHEHFQGGHYTFAMETAEIEKQYTIKDYEDVEFGIVNWPLSVIRIRSRDAKRVADLSAKILEKWKSYTDEDSYIYAFTEGVPHNTITPIARISDGKYEMDLTLRNNITTKENPFGEYHPHEILHHIKKENIGLIEVMGLAVLPSRLKEEMELISKYILEGKDLRANSKTEKHADWIDYVKTKHEKFTQQNIDSIIKEEIGLVFMQVLEDCGVFKCTEQGRTAFEKFIKTKLQGLNNIMK